jgi:hypothetical protein
MFNLFSKKTTEPQTVIAADTKIKRSYPAVVEQIHNEFFTAGDAILGEATSLLKELEVKDLNKGKRLAACGFGKTREAVVAIETENKLATTKEIAELVLYYQTNYPNNKFITEEQVKTICEKYDLVCGDTTMYKGFVPENKLSLIEKFKLQKKDIPYAVILDSWHGDEIVGYLKESDIVSDYGHRCITNENTFYIVAGDKLGYDEIKNPERFRNLGKGLATYENNRYLKAASAKSIKIKICAPLKDMEVPQGKEVKGYKIQNIPDPVVLHPVHGGYLIICAWGDEASDELVVNQKMN